MVDEQAKGRGQSLIHWEEMLNSIGFVGQQGIRMEGKV